MSNENKDLKKKATVVGTIALSAVLAGGIGYTGYNLLKDKTNEENSIEEVKSSHDEDIVATHAKVIPLEIIDEPDDLVATAVEFEEPGLILFDEQDDYSDLENAIANTEKQQENYGLFEDEVDEFQELNDSLVAVAAEGKVMVKENEVEILEPILLEPNEIDEALEVTEKAYDQKKQKVFERIVAIAKPSEPIIPLAQNKPSPLKKSTDNNDKRTLTPTKPVEPVEPETSSNLEPVILEGSVLPKLEEPNNSGVSEVSNDFVTADFPTESVEPVEPKEEENQTNLEGPAALEEENIESEITIAPTLPEEPVEPENPENAIEPPNLGDAVIPEEPTTQIDPSDPEIPSPENPSEQEEAINPEIPQKTIELEVPIEPAVIEDPVVDDIPNEPELPADLVDPIDSNETAENPSLETLSALEGENL